MTGMMIKIHPKSCEKEVLEHQMKKFASQDKNSV